MHFLKDLDLKHFLTPIFSNQKFQSLRELFIKIKIVFFKLFNPLLRGPDGTDCRKGVGREVGKNVLALPFRFLLLLACFKI